jgi:DNA-binding transcriptional ArsR family regulator
VTSARTPRPARPRGASGHRPAKVATPRAKPEEPGSETTAELKPNLVARDPGRRQLTDPVVMRALAHPVRIALLEALLREGPLTATAAAAILDDSPGNMSWHLNVLAKYGFVEEAEGGHGRSRPWRLVSLGTSFTDDTDDPELSVAGQTLSRVILERDHGRAQRWLNEQRTYPSKWRKAAFNSNMVTYLTEAELEKLGEDITELLLKYRERSFDMNARPAKARPVSISAIGHPLPLNPTRD